VGLKEKKKETKIKREGHETWESGGKPVENGNLKKNYFKTKWEESEFSNPCERRERELRKKKVHRSTTMAAVGSHRCVGVTDLPRREFSGKKREKVIGALRGEGREAIAWLGLCYNFRSSGVTTTLKSPKKSLQSRGAARQGGGQKRKEKRPGHLAWEKPGILGPTKEGTIAGKTRA